jgi:PAS domain S-box-containing protein
MHIDQEDIYRFCYENSLDAILLTVPGEEVLAANPAACKLFGMTEEELCSRAYADFVSGINSQDDSFLQDLKLRGRARGLLRFTRKDGSVFIAEVTSNVFSDSTGNLRASVTIRDQTERIASEKKIREAEERYRQIVELAQEGIWVIDENNKTSFVNHAMCEMLGYEESEMLGRPLFDFMNEYGKRITEKNIERRRQGIEERHDFVFQKKDGSLVYVIISTTPIFKDDSYGGAIAMVTDITQRKMTEEKLMRNEEKFRVMVENNYEAILLLDENLLTVYRSPSTSRVMGFTDEERLGKSYLELTHPDDIDKIKGFQQIVLNNPGKNIPITVRALHSSGHYLWFEGNATNLLGNKGVNGIVVNLRDISERKKADDALLELNKRLQVATRAANLGIWEWDLTTNELKWDPGMYKLYELNPDEFNVSYDKWTDFVYPDDLARLEKEALDAMKGTADLNTEFRVIVNNGRALRYIRSMALIVRDEKTGNPQKMIGCNWDITDQKLAAQEKEKILADLTKRNRDLEQFAYIISHNLRAPVANVMSLNDMLLSDDFDNDAEPEILEGLSRSIKQIDEIINDLNNIFQSKQLITEIKETVYFGDIVNDIQRSINHIIIAEGVNIVCGFEEVKSLFTVKGYLYSILYNLVLNAIKYRRASVAPLIHIESKSLENGVKITVADNGKGIDLKRNSAMLFGLYQRFDTSVEGKGMGLYMVKTQVEALGGTITVDSELGKGTIFTLRFLH